MKKIIAILAFAAMTFPAISKVSADNVTPIVNTYKDATKTSIVIDLPNGFNGSVMTTYDGNQFKTTYSTSTSITNDRINKINADIQAQEKALDDLFKAQQKIFQQRWSDWGWNW